MAITLLWQPITLIKGYLIAMALLLIAIPTLSPPIIAFAKHRFSHLIVSIGLANLEAIFGLIFGLLGLSIFLCGLFLILSGIFLAARYRHNQLKRICSGLVVTLFGLTDPFWTVTHWLIAMFR